MDCNCNGWQLTEQFVQVVYVWYVTGLYLSSDLHIVDVVFMIVKLVYTISFLSDLKWFCGVCLLA